MTIEDARLLMADHDALYRQEEDARDRLEKHYNLERQRAEAKLETDLERYLRGGEVRD